MPSNTGVNTAGDFSAALKEFYGPGIIGGLNEDVAYFDALSEGGAEVEVGGRGLIWPVHTGWSGGAGAIAEDSTLPTSGTQSRNRATANAKEIYGRIELTRKVMASSRSNKMAFVDALDAEMDGMEMELKKQLNRQLFGNDPTPASASAIVVGELGTVASTGATTITLDAPGTHQMHAGMKLLVGSTADIAAGNGHAVTIDNINSRTQITVSLNDGTTGAGSTTGIAATQVVAIGDLGGANTTGFVSFDQELLGLEHLITDNDDDLHGIITGTTPQWKSHVDDNGGVNRTLSPERMDAMFDGVYETGGKRPNFCISHNSFVREVKKLMEGDVRYEPQTYKGGFQRNLLVWNSGVQDVVIMSDHLCLPNRAFFLNLEYIKMGYLDRWSWLDEDGAILSRVSNKANFEAAYGAMLEQIVTKRNAHGVLKDITVNESTLVVPS